MSRRVSEYYCSNCGRSVTTRDVSAPPVCCGMPMTPMLDEGRRAPASPEPRRPAPASGYSAQRVVIVGGGLAGLSIAARLAQVGLPVTLLEAEQLGAGASTRNQGWLYSGAWFALRQPELARTCYQALEQTLRFCPDAVEPDRSMAYLFAEPESDVARWTQAWTAAGIPYEPLPLPELIEGIPGLAESAVHAAFRLPDRNLRLQVLLEHLAAAAENAGAEVCPGTPVARLLIEREQVRGVATRAGAEIRARLVILAGNASGSMLWPEPRRASGGSGDYLRVALKAHLVSVVPELGHQPFCVVDADGFNHVPHQAVSVLGTQRWLPVSDPLDTQVVPAELDRLWAHVQRFFPQFNRAEHQVAQWAGTTVHAYRYGRDPLEQVPPPAAIDHAGEVPRVQGLVSVFPSRASLWPQLAEQTTKLVLEKLQREPIVVAAPPWQAVARS